MSEIVLTHIRAQIFEEIGHFPYWTCWLKTFCYFCIEYHFRSLKKHYATIEISTVFVYGFYVSLTKELPTITMPNRLTGSGHGTEQNKFTSNKLNTTCSTKKVHSVTQRTKISQAAQTLISQVHIYCRVCPSTVVSSKHHAKPSRCGMAQDSSIDVFCVPNQDARDDVYTCLISLKSLKIIILIIGCFLC